MAKNNKDTLNKKSNSPVEDLEKFENSPVIDESIVESIEPIAEDALSEIKSKKKNKKEKPAKKASMKTLFKTIAPVKWLVIVGVVLAIFSTVLSIVGPRILNEMMEVLASPNFSLERVNTIGLFLVAIFLVAMFLSYFEGFLMSKVSTTITKNLRTSISKKINKLPLKYYDKTSFGDIISRVTNDVDTVGRGLNGSITSLISSITMIIAIPIIMLTISWELTLIALVEIPLSFGIVLLIVKFNQKYYTAQQKSLGELNGHVEEIYSAHNVVKAFNGEERASVTFNKLNTTLKNSARKAQFTSSLMHPIINTIGNIIYVVICLAGAWIAMKNNNPLFITSFITFLTYIRMFTQPISQIGMLAGNLQMMSAASERVFNFIEEDEEPDESHKTAQIKNVKGKVQFKNVDFGYTPDKQIIHKFNFTALPGQKIAIVGPTGAGKTTMVNLLMRFYEIDGGEILIDGVPTKDMNRSYLRSLFGMVLQDTWLFEGTIKENIAFGNPNATDEEIVNACKMANVDHFIRTEPQGYNMVMKEDSAISQGQKQLFTIARAMVQNSPMLILDEATSSVDTRTEMLIQTAMDRLMKGRTSFVIAHRLSTIKNADQIIVMKDGSIVETGNHQTLMEKGGFYKELYNSQFENGEEF